MDLQSYKDIEKIQDRLLLIVKDEYPYIIPNELYVRVAGAKIDYDVSDDDKPVINLQIAFGVYIKDQPDQNWQKEIELPLVYDDIDIIAGQFLQKILDEGL